MTTTKPELLPCPFCGGQPSYQSWHTSKNAVLIGCDNCDTVQFLGKNKPDAFRIWNTRTTAEPKVLEDAEQPVIHHNMGERFTVLPEMHSKQPVIGDGALAEAISRLSTVTRPNWLRNDIVTIRNHLDHASKNGAVEVTVEHLGNDIEDMMADISFMKDDQRHFADALAARFKNTYASGLKIIDGGK